MDPRSLVTIGCLLLAACYYLQVVAGEALVVLEAMKMEHTMYAKSEAVVEGIHAKEGDVVAQRAILVSFDQAAAAA